MFGLNETIIDQRTAVEKFLKATGHDLCHENRVELAKAFGLDHLVPKPPATVQEFDQGCRQYQKEVFGCSAIDKLREAVKYYFDKHHVMLSVIGTNLKDGPDGEHRGGAILAATKDLLALRGMAE